MYFLMLQKHARINGRSIFPHTEYWFEVEKGWARTNWMPGPEIGVKALSALRETP
jgi:hypothetical protein